MYRGLLLTLVLVLFGAPARMNAAPSEADNKRPNIVVVFADDLGWSDIGCYGGEIPTPHIDALAAKGLRFTQFYNNAVCGPSRTSLLTGLYCQQVGHRGTNWNDPTNFSHAATVADLLRAAGYFTMMVGKWQQRDAPSRRGFDRFFGPYCQAKISFFNEVQGNPYYLNDKRYKLPEDFYLTDGLHQHALNFLDEAIDRHKKSAQPFFLYVAHISPHWPLHAREADVAPHRERYRKHGWDHWRKERFARQKEMKLIPSDMALSPRPGGVHDWAKDKYKDWQAERMAVYAAQVASIDQGVGKIMNKLRAASVDDNTLVLFLSDNGGARDGGVLPSANGFGFSPGQKINHTWRVDGVPIRPGSGPKIMPGPHDTFAGYGLAWGTVSNTPWRDLKSSAYEGGIRTPLVVSWPRVIRKARIVGDMGHVIDFMPTFLDVAGSKYPETFQGRSLTPTEGKSLAPLFHGKARKGHEMLAWHAPRNDALRAGKWVLIRSTEKTPWQLYDLERDPAQMRDLAMRQPDIVHDLDQRWQAWAKRVHLKR